MAKKKKPSSNTIAQNKKARFDFELQESIEAGLALQGWEVKSLREGKVQLTDSYVIFKDSEAWLIGSHIQPLDMASTHYVTEPDRTRKLLLNRRQINHLIEATEQKGYTVVATGLHWKKHLVKCTIAVGKGKKKHDKRETIKEREWNIQKQRLLRHN